MTVKDLVNVYANCKDKNDYVFIHIGKDSDGVCVHVATTIGKQLYSKKGYNFADYADKMVCGFDVDFDSYGSDYDLYVYLND